MNKGFIVSIYALASVFTLILDYAFVHTNTYVTYHVLTDNSEIDEHTHM